MPRDDRFPELPFLITIGTGRDALPFLIWGTSVASALGTAALLLEAWRDVDAVVVRPVDAAAVRALVRQLK